MKTYWAAENEKIANNILERFDSYKKHLETSGALAILRKSYSKYYGSPHIEHIDESLKFLQVNHYANLIQHLLVMVTSQRPAWEPRSVNSDLASQADTELAEGLLDYYMREKGLEALFNKATEMSLFLREGWLSVDWDVQGGEIYGQNPENGQPIFEGEPVFKLHTMLDVARDVKRRDMANQWYILRTFVNKFDLAAQYTELAEEIAQLTADNRSDANYELNTTTNDIGVSETDMVPVYTLLHDKSPALPSGRKTVMLDRGNRSGTHGLVLFDGPLPTKKPYLFCMRQGDYIDTPFAHMRTQDLLPLQDIIDSTVSAIVTNQSANAVQNFQVPKGAAPRASQLAEGMNIFEYDPKAGKIEPLDLLRTAPEVFNFAEMMISNQQTLSGLSQVSRGDAPPTMSGTAMALLQQQAIQFSSGLQLSRTLFLENVGTSLIELLQTFAVVPRIANIVGKSKRTLMKHFKGDDLKGITRVMVDSGNALTKTAAGRMEIAKDLLNSGQIKTPDQYLSVLLTGNLEPLYQHDRSQLRLIQLENEALMEGQPAQAMLTDDHANHVLEHSTVADTQEARQNPQIVNALTAHIQEHINIAKGMDPVLAMMLKQNSFAPPPMPPPQQGPQGNMNGVLNAQNPTTEQANGVQPAQPAESPLNEQQSA